MTFPPALALVAVLSAPAAGADRVLVADSQVGPAFLSKSRSRAIGHAFKPISRLGLRAELTPRLELGGSLSGILDASEHYRVLGALAHGRFALWNRPTFSVGASLGMGAGRNADILHADLAANAAVLPYGFVSLDARWLVAERWLLGCEAGWENLSIVRLGLLFGYRFGR